MSLAALAFGVLAATPSLAAAPPCVAAAAQAAAPPGVTVGAINDLNPELSAAPTGALTIAIPQWTAAAS